MYYPTGLGDYAHLFYVSSVNGFKFLYLETIPSGNEEGLSLLAMWIPVNSLIQDESNLHSSNTELSCVSPQIGNFPEAFSSVWDVLS